MRYAVLLLLAVSGSLTWASDWPGFRRAGDGVAPDAKLPIKWSDTENLAWKVDLPGYGQSAPIVWNGTVYVTSVDGNNRDKGLITALDAKTGKARWTHTFEPTIKAKMSSYVTRGGPTPCVDSEGVYAFFEGGNLLSVGHDGKVRWERSLVKDYGEFQNNHGLAASPCQTDDTLFVLVDHSGPSYLLAVDKATGKTKWKTDRTSRGSWASPVMATRAGKPEIVVSSGGTIAGYDPATGKQTWELTGLSGNTTGSAAWTGDRLLVGASLGRGGMGDAKAVAKTNCCLELTPEGYKVAWTAKTAMASFASPVANKTHAYYVNGTGVVVAVDLKTGEEVYSERLPGPSWASPIVSGDYVYFFGKDGITAVVKAGDEFEIVAKNRLGAPGAASTPKEEPKEEPSRDNGGGRQGGGGRGNFSDSIVYGVAASDNAIFIRTGTQLYRVSK